MEEKQTHKEKFWVFMKEKFLSRKLLVWVTATILLVLKVISEEIWMYLSMVYIGVNSALAAIEVIKRKGGTLIPGVTVPDAVAKPEDKLPPA